MATKKIINDAELTEILSEVQVSLDGLLKAEAEKMAKAHPGEETSAETDPDESATAPAGDASASASPPAPDAGSPTDEGSGDAAPPTDASASAPAGDDGSGAPAGDDGSAGGDPAADASTNPEELVPHYASLPIEALKAHYLASKMALAAKMGSAGSDPSMGGGDGSAAPPGAPSPDASASASAPPALKGELPTNTEGNGEDPLHPKTAKKSETDLKIDVLQKTLAEQEVAMAGLLGVVKTIVEAPVRKSVTSIADVTPAAPAPSVDVSKLSKPEINARLRKAAEGNLAKSDRDLINSYSYGRIKAEDIAHLLK